MVIEELYIKNFGKFSNEQIVLQPGINVLYGENERGKTTVYHFIKGMLFGIERQRGRASRNDIYSTYEPWDNPLYYAGVMRFSTGGKMFRIERSFSKSQKEARLVCETDGEELSIEHGDLDILLDGLKEEVFDNTISVGQLKVKTESSLAGELKNSAANYFDTGDFDLNIDQAKVSLNEKKKEFRKKIKEEQDKKEDARSDIYSKMEVVKADVRKTEEELQEIWMEQRKGGDPAAEIRKTSKRPFLLPGIILATASICMAFLFSFQIYSLAGAVIGVLIGLFLITRKPVRTVGETKSSSQPEGKHQAYLEELLREKKTALENFYEELDEMEEVSEEIKAYMKEIQALDLAMETIDKVSSDIRKEQGSLMNRRISEIVASLTNGKYESLFADEDMDIKINTSYKLLKMEQLSRGTIEQVYFALRMAAADALFPDSEMPVIYDDTFAMYDEKRLEAVLHWLYENKRQVLIFTCHKREAEILKRLNIPFGAAW